MSSRLLKPPYILSIKFSLQYWKMACAKNSNISLLHLYELIYCFDFLSLLLVFFPIIHLSSQYPLYSSLNHSPILIAIPISPILLSDFTSFFSLFLGPLFGGALAQAFSLQTSCIIMSEIFMAEVIYITIRDNDVYIMDTTTSRKQPILYD